VDRHLQLAARSSDPEESRWRLRKDGGDIDAISGATVSSRAVVAATRRAMQYFRLHRDEIFAAPSTSAADTSRD
jgi:electron transport complex protein RnfG